MRVRKSGLWPMFFGIGLFAFAASGCSSDASGTVPDGVDSDCTGADAIITAANDHVHDVDIPDMDAVRAREQAYVTTLDDGHTHEVTVTATDFARINMGNVVYKVTSRSQGHTHPIAMGCTY